MLENIAIGVALGLAVVVVLAIEFGASLTAHVQSEPHDLTHKHDRGPTANLVRSLSDDQQL